MLLLYRTVVFEDVLMTSNKQISHFFINITFLFAAILSLSLLIPCTASADEITTGTALGNSAENPLIVEEDHFVTDENGLHYNFSEDDHAKDTWLKYDDKLYYFDSSEKAVRNMIAIINDHQYYFDWNCICQFGIVYINDIGYYFTPGLGMNHGWVSDEGDNDIYYFDDDGTMHHGYLTIDDQVYYFAEDGRMHTGWLKNEETGKTQYFNKDGMLLLGWQEIDGTFYSFNYDEDVTISGWMSEDMWVEKDGIRAYVDENGRMARNCELEFGGIRYTFDNEGRHKIDLLSGMTNNWAYLLLFLSTTVLVFLGSYGYRKIEIVSNFLVIVLVVLFAALRADSVGYDIRVYVRPQYDYLINDPSVTITDFFSRFRNMEPMFNLMVYICARYIKSIRVLLGGMALIINGFILKGICIRNGKSTRWFAWAAYCLLLFNTTLNIMRQFMGLALLFYLFSNEEKLSWKRVVLFSAIATTMHYSCALGIVFYAMLLFYRSEKFPGILKKILGIIVISMPFTGSFLVGNAFKILIDKFPGKFTKYDVFIFGSGFNNGYTQDCATILMVLTGILVFVFIPYSFNFREEGMKNTVLRSGLKNDSVLMTGAFTDLCYALFYNILNSRFQYFVMIMRPEYYAAGFRAIKDDSAKTRRRAVLIQAGLIVLMLLYWFYTYVYQNTDTTSPYRFYFD